MRKAISAPCLLALGQRGLHQVRTGETNACLVAPLHAWKLLAQALLHRA